MRLFSLLLYCALFFSTTLFTSLPQVFAEDISVDKYENPLKVPHPGDSVTFTFHYPKNTNDDFNAVDKYDWIFDLTHESSKGGWWYGNGNASAICDEKGSWWSGTVKYSPREECEMKITDAGKTLSVTLNLKKSRWTFPPLDKPGTWTGTLKHARGYWGGSIAGTTITYSVATDFYLTGARSDATYEQCGNCADDKKTTFYVIYPKDGQYYFVSFPDNSFDAGSFFRGYSNHSNDNDKQEWIESKELSDGKFYTVLALKHFDVGDKLGKRTVCLDRKNSDNIFEHSTECERRYQILVVAPGKSPELKETRPGAPVEDNGSGDLPDSGEPIPPLPPCADQSFIKNGNCSVLNTGFGVPITTDPAGFIKSLFQIILSIAGGIAVLLLMRASYAVMTSRGKPETIQGAKETISSTILGLLFIIFSFLLLQLIGVNILQIPGFNR